MIIKILGLVWLLSVAVFAGLLYSATDGFTGVVQNTDFGNSDSFPLILLGVGGLGLLAFLVIVGIYWLKLARKYKFIRYGSIALLLTIVFFIGVIYSNLTTSNSNIIQNGLINTNTSNQPSNGTAPNPKELIELTNKERVSSGLNPVTYNEQLEAAAKLKAQDMFERDYWSHNAPDGTEPWVFYRKVGYNYVHAGENLARDFIYPAEIVRGWMNSPLHRENLMNPKFTEIGIAVEKGFLTGGNTYLVVQMLGAPSTYIPTSEGVTTLQQEQTINIETIKSHLAQIQSVKSSWEKAYGQYPKEDLDRLLDSFNRQIDFCGTLVQRLDGGKKATQDDIRMWDEVIKMSNESAAITNRLNSQK